MSRTDEKTLKPLRERHREASRKERSAILRGAMSETNLGTRFTVRWWCATGSRTTSAGPRSSRTWRYACTYCSTSSSRAARIIPRAPCPANSSRDCSISGGLCVSVSGGKLESGVSFRRFHCRLYGCRFHPKDTPPFS